MVKLLKHPWNFDVRETQTEERQKMALRWKGIGGNIAPPPKNIDTIEKDNNQSKPTIKGMTHIDHHIHQQKHLSCFSRKFQQEQAREERDVTF